MPSPPTQSERQLREATLDWLALFGGNAGLWIVIDIRHPRPGAPDIVVLAALAYVVEGIVFESIGQKIIAVAIELKSKRGRLEPEQARFADNWTRQGGYYIMPHSTEELAARFRAIGLPVREVES